MEAIKSSAETNTLLGEAKAKRQELSDARLFVEDVAQQLKSEFLGSVGFMNLVRERKGKHFSFVCLTKKIV